MKSSNNANQKPYLFKNFKPKQYQVVESYGRIYDQPDKLSRRYGDIPKKSVFVVVKVDREWMMIKFLKINKKSHLQKNVLYWINKDDLEYVEWTDDS